MSMTGAKHHAGDCLVTLFLKVFYYISFWKEKLVHEHMYLKKKQQKQKTKKTNRHQFRINQDVFIFSVRQYIFLVEVSNGFELKF